MPPRSAQGLPTPAGHGTGSWLLIAGLGESGSVASEASRDSVKAEGIAEDSCSIAGRVGT